MFCGSNGAHSASLFVFRFAAKIVGGEVSERSKELASKASVGETQPWVRIPPSPPFFLLCFRRGLRLSMLNPGDKLGSYEIVGPLGAGGMGEVYVARDVRLDRNVAIKILPAEFAADGDRLRRFEREARAASALNHPNIVTIYELGQRDSTHYIAMELVRGKTLREFFVAGSLPIKTAIDIAAQISEGLAKAHEAGIAHRDIKPANLMVTSDGLVKILDFGLAKLAPKSDAVTEIDSQPELQTKLGMVLGTPEYMSPEQASGLTADFRSDQFSFGLVLYEMVTGKRAFRRSTIAETIVAVLREQPQPIAAQAPDAPAPLCWAIDRCLAKDPNQRYASTRDLARELAAIRDRFSQNAAAPTEARVNNIPAQRTGFVGREKEIAAAKELLLRHDVRLFTVTGPGGIGKTRLAVEVANGIVDSFPGGIHYVSLSPLNDPGLLAAAIVQALGLRETGGQAPMEILQEEFAGFIARRQCCFCWIILSTSQKPRPPWRNCSRWDRISKFW